MDMVDYIMSLLKLPPKIKVLEASGSLADGRVKIISKSDYEVRAIVESSLGDRTYKVIIRFGQGRVLQVYSDDNGTRFRGYIGYPILSVLMLIGLLPRNSYVEESMKGIPWRILNEKFKSYERVLEEVIKIASSQKSMNAGLILEDYMKQVIDEVSKYRVYYINI
ncbi:MAG: hypothetical protein QXD80_02850 [Acidilobaceae archaeon]